MDYKVWAVDNVVYGPVDFGTLEAWVQDERVAEDTWIYQISKDIWFKASDFSQFKVYFDEEDDEDVDTRLQSKAHAVSMGTLKRIKLFGLLDDNQLKQLGHFLEYRKHPPYSLVVKNATPSDRMFFVIEGEARVRINVEGRECILATLVTGDFFGEHCLFDQAPRSADVLTNVESELYSMSVASFQRMTTERPALAASLLLAIGKTMVVRIRANNKKLESMMQVWRSFRK
jgi:CRP-like cAMP-binding protein